MVNYSTLDATFGALSDPTRRAILARLAQGEATVTELAEPFDVSLPAVSKHLRVLESAGLLRREIDGRIHRCRLSPQPIRDASRWIEEYRRFWEHQFDALANYLESQSSAKEKQTCQQRKANAASPSKSAEPSRRRAKRSSRHGRNASS